MIRDTDLVEKAMQLADDGVYLLREIAGVHFGRVSLRDDARWYGI